MPCFTRACCKAAKRVNEFTPKSDLRNPEASFINLILFFDYSPPNYRSNKFDTKIVINYEKTKRLRWDINIPHAASGLYVEILIHTYITDITVWPGDPISHGRGRV